MNDARGGPGVSVARLTRGFVTALVAATVGCASTGHKPSSGPSVAGAGAVASAINSSDAAAPRMSSSADAFPAREWGIRGKVTASGALMLESSSAALVTALAGQAHGVTADSEVALAQAYMSHGVLDKASEHFGAAARLNPREGAAWDGLARVWREWGFSRVGLGDAYRAVYSSPADPAVHNTLGTILQALGRGPDARARFARAAALDSRAAYALNNLCYSWLTEANPDAAIAECTRALEVDPTLVAARANLLLARALAAQRTEKESLP